MYGIPTGGTKLATALVKYTNKDSIYYLIVDDVLTTGTSMEKAAKSISDRSRLTRGVVIFSRSEIPIPEWIHPIFNMSKWLKGE